MVENVGHHGDRGGRVERSVSYTFEEVEREQGGTKAEGVVYSGQREDVDQAGRPSAAHVTLPA